MIIREFDEWLDRDKPDDFGDVILLTYFCIKCKSWCMFQFENWGMCDDCALLEALQMETETSPDIV